MSWMCCESIQDLQLFFKKIDDGVEALKSPITRQLQSIIAFLTKAFWRKLFDEGVDEGWKLYRFQEF